MYTINKECLLPYNGTEGLLGNKYTWKSSNSDALSVDTRSLAVEELSKFGYTEEQIKAYKDKGTNYVTVVVANPGDKVPASGIKVTLTGSMEVDDKAYSKSFDIMVYPENNSEETTDESKARADLNAITSISSGMTISSSKTIDLPSVGTVNGSNITWSSSDSSYINTNTGKVTIPSSSRTVVLTATAEFGTAKVTKQFSIYLKGTNSSSGGSGGSGGGGSSRPLIVPGTVTNDNEKFGTDAYTPEDTSKMIFNDIEGVSWAKEAIEALYNKNVISGYGNGFFAPERSVTREQFVKMLVGALGLDTNTESSVSFSDVPEDEWFTPYINAAAALGIVSGKDDGSFGVGESITRQDMAVMCTRALNAVGKTLGEGSSSFNDGDKISDYAKSAVGSMAAAGYLTGDENGSFNPTDTATRAQTAVVLYRIIK